MKGSDFPFLPKIEVSIEIRPTASIIVMVTFAPKKSVGVEFWAAFGVVWGLEGGDGRVPCELEGGELRGVEERKLRFI